MKSYFLFTNDRRSKSSATRAQISRQQRSFTRTWSPTFTRIAASRSEHCASVRFLQRVSPLEGSFRYVPVTTFRRFRYRFDKPVPRGSGQIPEILGYQCDAHTRYVKARHWLTVYEPLRLTFTRYPYRNRCPA